MASLSSVRALLPAAHGVPAAALKAAAMSGASFLVVCPAGNRAKAMLAALQATTKGAGLVLPSRMVARATKRSGGGVEDGRTGEDPEKLDDVFFVEAGEEVTNDDTNTKVEKAFFIRAGEDRTGEEDANGDTNTKDVNVFFVEAGEDRTGEEDTNGDTEPKDVFFAVGDNTHEVRTSNGESRNYLQGRLKVDDY